MDTNIETLRKKCLTCSACGLCTTRTNVVFGTGAEKAEVMFVGEGPGKSEDEQGLPFVGKSGMLLDQYLYHIDLNRRKDIYIANVVKCRPPQNRDPLPEEVSCCRYWLNTQISLIKPKIIVCLGRIAAKELIAPDISIRASHGKFFSKNGIEYMCTFHPAALLRNPAAKLDALADFIALRERIEKICEHTYFN